MKFFMSLFGTLAFILLLDRSWTVGDTRIPPLGKFLDPLNGFCQNAEPRIHIDPEDLRVKGLKQRVIVQYVSLLKPHFFATDEEDQYMSPGFVAAHHGLWQMASQSLAAAG